MRTISGRSDWSEVWSLTTVAAAPQGTPTNLLVNPGFEVGLNSLVLVFQRPGRFLDNLSGVQQRAAGKFSVTATGDNTQIFQYDIVLNPNTRYVVSFAAYSNTDMI